MTVSAWDESSFMDSGRVGVISVMDSGRVGVISVMDGGRVGESSIMDRIIRGMGP